MIVEGTHSLPGAPEQIWHLLMDPDVLAKAMPGTRSLVLTSPNRFEGKMVVGIGPITAAEFDLLIELVDVRRPVAYRMEIYAKGRHGFSRGAAQVELVPDGETTTMRYWADLQVGGKIAALGQRLLDSVSKLLVRQGLNALSREVSTRLGRGQT